ncbi:hypothetical protein AUJ69_03660 [Candidatus Woesearchaeota archaeon CG1_02_47_18]|nr:MAG: hypothetical protein AUJ69_03660 [Candidatus Woesearchaeota archaeon CG1_02_47_18]
MYKNPEKYLGKEITIAGTAGDKIGLPSVNGFKLEHKGKVMAVLYDNAHPEKGKLVRVSGILKKSDLLGYYLEADGWEGV